VPTTIDANNFQASFVMAITMLASTSTMITTCIQIQWRGIHVTP
jgi:hypothetical protein